MKEYKVGFENIKHDPEYNKYYSVPVKGAVSSDGTKWHGIIKRGPSDNLLVYFVGGGLSVNSFTAARSHQRTDSEGNGFYCPNFYPDCCNLENGIIHEGITVTDKYNPFCDWNVIVVTYTTGDLSIGNSIKKYTDLSGKEKTIYYNGYNNVTLFFDKCSNYIGNEFNNIVIAGYSAGGFSASLLFDDILSVFHPKNRVSAVVDCSLFRYNWGEVLEKEWNAPPHIRNISKTDDLSYDGINHIYEKYGNNAGIVFGCSFRDYALSQSQVYFDKIEEDMPTEVTKEAGDRFQKYLKETTEKIIDTIPTASVYIWDNPFQKEGHITRHTGTDKDVFFLKLNNEISFCDSVVKSLEGNRTVQGINLLSNSY